MPWGNLAQTDLSDALIQHHEALTELDDINQLIDWKLIEARLSVSISVENFPLSASNIYQ